MKSLFCISLAFIRQKNENYQKLSVVVTQHNFFSAKGTIIILPVTVTL